jgi:hypothetical protein
MLGGSLGIKSGCEVEGTSGSASVSLDCDDSAFGGDLDLKSLDLGDVPFCSLSYQESRALVSIQRRDSDRRQAEY